MFRELDPSQFDAVRRLFADRHLEAGSFQDPLMHAVLEGRRAGRVFADDTKNPGLAAVWTGSECAYLAAGPDQPPFGQAVRRLLDDEILAPTQALGSDYVSVFVFPNSRAAEVEALLADLYPLRTAVNTFAFDAGAYAASRSSPVRLSAGYTLQPISRDLLADPANAGLAGEIGRYWDDLDAMQEVGHCVVREGELVSWCYVQASGAGAQTIDIWTAPAHRRRGLATAVGRAFIDRCLAQGQIPFWLCDEANAASRALAARLAFEVQGDLHLVDVPFQPFQFYSGLAAHFFLPNGEYDQAAEIFERAFAIGEGEAGDYYQAAVTRAMLEDEAQALAYLHAAAARGWRDVEGAEADPAFARLRETPGWQAWLDTLAPTSDTA